METINGRNRKDRRVKTHIQDVSTPPASPLLRGYAGTDEFGLEDPITREQIAAVIWRQAGNPEGSSDLSGFPDGADTSSWASNAMSWAVDTGLFLGDDATGELNPVDNLTRAQAAAVMMRKLTEL